MLNDFPQGITAPVIREINIVKPGPKMNNNLSAPFGIKSSLKKNFPPSAKGCKSPQKPALFGPILSCRNAATFLSAQVEYAATPMDKANKANIKIPLKTISFIKFSQFIFLRNFRQMYEKDT